MAFLDTLCKMATFQSKYFIVSLLFYLFIFLLIDLLVYQIRTRRCGFGKPEETSPARQQITDRLKSVFGLDDREWEAEDKKQYVRGLSKRKEEKQSGAEDDGEEFLQVIYRADDVQSLEFSEDNGAFLFPYKITVNGKAVSQEKDATVRRGDKVEVDTGISVCTPAGADAVVTYYEGCRAGIQEEKILRGTQQKLVSKFVAGTDGRILWSECIGRIQVK